MQLLNSKPADLASTLDSLAFVSEVKNTMAVDQLVETAVMKRNEELYDMEMNKETQFLILDLHSLLAAKPLFGKVLNEFASMGPGGINEENFPTLTQIF